MSDNQYFKVDIWSIFSRIIICSILGLCTLSSVDAQEEDKQVLSKNFKFADGIYLNYESFKNNRPDYSWDQLKSNLVSNPQTFLTQVEYIRLKEGGVEINLEELWGISLGGIPYIRLKRDEISKPLTAFAGIQLRGNICYFSYEDVEMRKIRMPVYNPVHKIPYQIAYVERPIYLYYEKMLRFETGETADLNVANLSKWIADDSQLAKAVAVLDANETGEKLFKCLLIYDDRHLVYIPGKVEQEN